MWWKFSMGIQIHWCNKIHNCNENSSILSKLIVVMKIHLGDEIDHCNKDFINWWLLIIVIKMNRTMKIHHGHKIHQLMKIYIFDRCSLFWWKFIIVIQFIIVIKLQDKYQYDISWYLGTYQACVQYLHRYFCQLWYLYRYGHSRYRYMCISIGISQKYRPTDILLYL